MKSKQLVFLAQSDTTVGLLSKDKRLLNKIKNRPLDKPCIECISSLDVKNIRVSQKYKNLVRRSSKKTFILPNGYSFRVVKEPHHLDFLKRFKSLYSTSANKSGEFFDKGFASKYADITIEDIRELYESTPSRVLKLGKTRLKRVR